MLLDVSWDCTENVKLTTYTNCYLVRYELTSVEKIWKPKETEKKNHFYTSLQNLSLPVLILMNGSRNNLVSICMVMNICHLLPGLVLVAHP